MTKGINAKQTASCTTNTDEKRIIAKDSQGKANYLMGVCYFFTKQSTASEQGLV
jgi:hypothetical protein